MKPSIIWPLYLVKCRTRASDRSCVASLKKWMALKQPVDLSHRDLSFRQATSQKLLAVSIFCADICFKLLASPVNGINHHALLEFSPLWISWMRDGMNTRETASTCVLLLGFHCHVQEMMLKLHTAVIVHSFSLVKNKPNLLLRELVQLQLQIPKMDFTR